MATNKNIILLHGWGAGVAKLEPLALELKKLGWQIEILKLPGFDLEPPNTAWNLEDFMHFVKNQAWKKFKGNYYIFGHSFGGRIAIKTATTDPKNVRGIVLAATGGISRGNLIKRVVFYFLAKTGKSLLLTGGSNIFKKLLYKFAREHDYEKSNGTMRDTFKKVINENLKPHISRISIPTLVLWGTADKTTPLKDAHFLIKNLKKGKLVTFAGHGHKLPYNLPFELAKEINKWA